LAFYYIFFILKLTTGIGCTIESKTHAENSNNAVVLSATTLSVTLTSIGKILTSSGEACNCTTVGYRPCFSALK
jgi:hypothetical protein